MRRARTRVDVPRAHGLDDARTRTRRCRTVQGRGAAADRERRKSAPPRARTRGTGGGQERGGGNGRGGESGEDGRGAERGKRRNGDNRSHVVRETTRPSLRKGNGRLVFGHTAVQAEERSERTARVPRDQCRGQRRFGGEEEEEKSCTRCGAHRAMSRGEFGSGLVRRAPDSRAVMAFAEPRTGEQSRHLPSMGFGGGHGICRAWDSGVVVTFAELGVRERAGVTQTEFGD